MSRQFCTLFTYWGWTPNDLKPRHWHMTNLHFMHGSAAHSADKQEICLSVANALGVLR